MPTTPLDALPIWAVYLLLVVLGFLVIEAGYRLGRYWTSRRREPEKPKENIDALMGATLALLAFLLVFMIGIASNRFDHRRQLVVQEANAIGTTYLRAGYLEEPFRTEVRNRLREYVDVRIKAASDPANLAQYRERAEVLLVELWDQAEALARAHPDFQMAALFIESVNSVIDLHTERMVAVALRISPGSWLAILAVASLALAMVGLDIGVSDRYNPLAQLVLVLVFAAVLLLIVDLDRPLEGLLQVGQQALIDLQQQIQVIGP
jgi:hypothetical protein